MKHLLRFVNKRTVTYCFGDINNPPKVTNGYISVMDVDKTVELAIECPNLYSLDYLINLNKDIERFSELDWPIYTRMRREGEN